LNITTTLTSLAQESLILVHRCQETFQQLTSDPFYNNVNVISLVQKLVTFSICTNIKNHKYEKLTITFSRIYLNGKFLIFSDCNGLLHRYQYHLISLWWFLRRSCTFHLKISASIMVFSSKKDFMSWAVVPKHCKVCSFWYRHFCSKSKHSWRNDYRCCRHVKSSVQISN
jgi:hypothetical protein